MICGKDMEVDLTSLGYQPRGLCSIECLRELEWRKALSLCNREYMEKQRPPKPFPILCPECGKMAVCPTQRNYKPKICLKGESVAREIELGEVTLLICQECGGTIVPNETLELVEKKVRSLQE